MKRTLLLLLAILAIGITQAQITAPAVEQKQETDPRYLAGAVQEVEGKAELNREFNLPVGVTMREAAAIIDLWLKRCSQDKRILHEATLPTTADNIICHAFTMEITFSQSFFSHDWSNIYFVLTMTINDGKVLMTMNRIRYDYLQDGKVKRFPAEETITDKIALNKKKTKLMYGLKKFRIHTIDMLDEMQISLQKEFEQ